MCAGGKLAPRAGQQAEPRGQRNLEGQAGDLAEGQAGDHAGSKLEGKGSTFSLCTAVPSFQTAGHQPPGRSHQVPVVLGALSRPPQSQAPWFSTTERPQAALSSPFLPIKPCCSVSGPQSGRVHVPKRVASQPVGVGPVGAGR